MEGLTVGRMVHYVVEGKVEGKLHRAAIVVSVRDPGAGICDLACFGVGNTNGDCPVFFKNSVPYDPECANHTWHWIERA